MVQENISKIMDNIILQNNLEKYLETENLDKLHKLKIYIDDLYYNVGKSPITDWKYDILKETLQRRDPSYIVPIGAKIRNSENRKKLPYWLGSMDKFKPEDTIQISRWIKLNKSSNYVIEDKLDGVSCLLVLENSKIKLYTRGDGKIGADISYLLQYFKTIPKIINENIVVRGEFIMKKKVFLKKYATKYANARNLVAGTLGAKTIKNAISDIDFVAYEIIEKNTKIMSNPKTQLQKLKKLGFLTVQHKFVDNFTIKSLINSLIEFKKISQYEIDGIIIQSNKDYIRNTSGNPNYAFAFKMMMDSNIVETEVVKVKWNISKWGIFKPIVEIKPVNLGGVKITNTTGFNGKYIKDNSIGPGAIIKVTRSGDVIPYITTIIKKASKPQMPDYDYKWTETMVDIYNDNFEDIVCVKIISSFFDKLGIKHVKERLIKKMYDYGLNNLIKILSASKDDFLKIDGFKAKLVIRTYNNIHNNLKDLSIPTVLGASGIFGFGIGIRKIKLLFDEIPEILNIYQQLSYNDFYNLIINIEGYSDKTVKKIIHNIEWANKFINSLKPFVTFKNIDIKIDLLKGTKFVFSGFRDKNLEDKILNMKGKITTSVSKNTTAVIVKKIEQNPTGKIQKALKLGIKVYEKDEFISKYLS